MSCDRSQAGHAPPKPAWHADEIRAATALVPIDGTDGAVLPLDEPVPSVAVADERAAGNEEPDPGATRREVVRQGVKLAFAAPLLSTFLASQAYAANYSCYPAGHACTNLGTDLEPCCNGACPGAPDVCP